MQATEDSQVEEYVIPEGDNFIRLENGVRERQIWTDGGKVPEARTVLQALLNAQLLLLNEERWVKGTWWRNHNPNSNPDDAFCNSWEVCAGGALAVVTVGMHRRVAQRAVLSVSEGPLGEATWGLREIPKAHQKWDLWWGDDSQNKPDEELTRIYEEASKLLAKAGSQVTGRNFHTSVPNFNDETSTTRQDVLQAFTLAIVWAAQEEIKGSFRQSLDKAFETTPIFQHSRTTAGSTL